MRRIKILFYWVFKARNNVSFSEMVRFLLKPNVKTLGAKYIKRIEDSVSQWEITFNTIPYPLYWPKECPLKGIYQVSCETFDREDWHYYQKENTEVTQGEVLVDVGAAEGLFTLSVIDRCERAILIEPNDFFVASLRDTFEKHIGKVTICNVAVGDQEGEIHFNPNSLSGKIEKNAGIIKELKTIDSLLQGERKITFLKADLEGFEEAMLKGAEQTIKRHKPKLAITSYHLENNPAEIIKIIKGFVPEYQHRVNGIIEAGGKPVMIHFWL